MSYKYETGLNCVTKVFPGGVRAVDGNLGPRELSAFGELAGRAEAYHLSTKVAGSFTGVFVGPYCTGSGRPHVDWFEWS